VRKVKGQGREKERRGKGKGRRHDGRKGEEGRHGVFGWGELRHCS